MLHGTVDENVVFFMDSEYVRKGISHYLAVRKTNDRKTVRKKPIHHQLLRQRLQCLLECFVDIQRHRVEGHSGDPYNDAVDKRARKQAIHQKNRTT